MTTQELFAVSPIVPVVVLDDAERAVALADALLEGGVGIMEITLRSDAALASIEAVATKVPEMQVGAGTVINTAQFQKVQEAGGRFCFSPGISAELLAAAKASNLPLIPGVATASDVMTAINAGIEGCKFFPAEAAGGVAMLKAFGGPFASMHFCPTGGVNLVNMKTYLALDNVDCVGGSWITPKAAIEAGDFAQVTALCREALAAL